MSIKLLKIEEFSKEQIVQWDALLSDDFACRLHSTYAWLYANSKTEESGQLMAVDIDDKEQIRAGLPFCITKESIREHYNLKNFIEGPDIYSKIKVKTNIDFTQFFPAVLITSISGGGCDFRYHKDNSDEENKNALVELIKELEKIKGIRFLYFAFVSERSKYLTSILLQLGYLKAVQGYRYFLEPMLIPEYLLGFRSNRKRKIKKEILEMNSPDVVFERKSIEEGIDDFLELSRKNFEKYNPDTPFNYEFGKKKIIEFTERLSEGKPFFTSLNKEGKRHAILYSIIYDGGLYNYMLGTDYEVTNKKFPAYFILGYYYSLIICKQEGLKFIQIYDGLDITKRSRGCKYEKLFLYYKKELMNDELRQAVERMSTEKEKYFKNFE